MSHSNDDVRALWPSTEQLVLGGVLWISTLVYFVGQAIAHAAWKTPYSLIDNPISDLGITTCGTWPPPGVGTQIAARLGTPHGYLCSPLHDVMNVSFILTGALLLLGLYVTRTQWPRRRLTTWGLAFLSLAGLGKIVVGLAPENVLIPHAIGGLGNPCGSIGLVLLGLAVLRERRWVGIFSIVLGGVGLLALPAGSLLVLAIGHGTGAAERVGNYPVIVWAVVLGISLMRRSWASLGHDQPVLNELTGRP
jgi:hypothetical membrane protein